MRVLERKRRNEKDTSENSRERDDLQERAERQEEKDDGNKET